MTAAAALQTPEEIARRSGSSFLVSFSALVPPRRRALTAIYAFCRVADDAADDAESARDGKARLALWRAELEGAAAGTAATVLGQRLAAAIREFGVDVHHLRAVLDGVQMDLDGAGFATFDQLLAYCDKVASAVGLACLPVFGVTGPHAERYAIALGRALQLTNIARDLRFDAKAGRIYVPQEWLAAAGADPTWLQAMPHAQSVRALAALVDRLVDAARGYFAESERELRQIADRRLLLAPETMAAVYRRLLDLVADGGVRALQRGQRLRVPGWQKLWLAWRTRRRLQ